MSKLKNSKASLKTPIKNEASKTSSKKEKSRASIKTKEKSKTRKGSIRSLLSTAKKDTKNKSSDEKSLKNKSSKNVSKKSSSDSPEMKNSELKKSKTNNQDKKPETEKPNHSNNKSSHDIQKNKSTNSASKNKSSNEIQKNKSTTSVSKNKSSNKIQKNKSTTSVSKNKPSNANLNNKSSTSVSKNKSRNDIQKNKSTTSVSKNKSTNSVSKNKSSNEIKNNKSTNSVSQNKSSEDIPKNHSNNSVSRNKSDKNLSQSSIRNKPTLQSSQNELEKKSLQNSDQSKLDTIPENLSEKSESKSKLSDKIDLENIFPVLGDCDISPLGEIIDRIDQRNIGRSNTCDRFPYNRKRSLVDMANEVDKKTNDKNSPSQSKNSIKSSDDKKSLPSENTSKLKNDLANIESKDDYSESSGELYTSDSIFSVNSVKSSSSNKVVSLFDVFNIETDEKVDELFERIEREECNKLATLQAQALRNRPKGAKDDAPCSIEEEWNNKRVQEREAVEQEEREKNLIKHDKNGIRSEFFGTAMPRDCAIDKFYDRLQSKIVGTCTDNLFHLSDKLMDELKSVNRVNHFKNSQQARVRLDQFCDEFHQLKAEGRLQITNSATNQMFENLPFSSDDKTVDFQSPTSVKNNSSQEGSKEGHKKYCNSSDPKERFMNSLAEQINILSKGIKKKVKKEKCVSDETIDSKNIFETDTKNDYNKQNDSVKKSSKNRKKSNCSLVSDTNSTKSRKSVCFQLCRDNSDPRIVFPGKYKQNRKTHFPKSKRSRNICDSDSDGSFEYEIVRI